MDLKTLVAISRPRFWLYAAGTFLVGAAAGVSHATDLLAFLPLVYLVYFIFPANVFIYGINDLYDDDTDISNPKKGTKEHLLKILERKSLQKWVAFSIAFGVVLAVFSPNVPTLFFWATSLFLAWAYSSKPFRFKAKPVIDAVSNVHYAVIGFLAYSFFTGEVPPWWAIAAAWCWTASMHIYSAVPDIASDARAKLKTTAVVLGARNAVVLCIVLWITTSVLILQNFMVHPVVWLTLAYPLLGILTLFKLEKIVTIYWAFPYVNALLGFILCALVYFN